MEQNTQNRIPLKTFLNAYQKNKTEQNKQILNGEIYEYYCYDKIIESYPNIHIILSKTQENKYDNGFAYRNFGSIYYTQYNIDLGEFDILGLDDNGTLYWWESTTAQTNLNAIFKHYKKKNELIQKLFDKVIFNVIIPEKNDNFDRYQTLIIPAPDFEKYYNEYYEIKSDMSNCWTLEKLRQSAKEYDYIDDIIKLSEQYYSEDKIEFKSYLIERLYNLKEIHSNSITYYNTIRKSYEKIIIEDGKKYKVTQSKKERLKGRKATSFEFF